MLHWQVTGDKAQKLRNLVVWTHDFKVVGSWELCASLSALGPRMLSQSNLNYLLRKHMKTKISCTAKHSIGPGEQGGKYADFQQLSQFVGQLWIHRTLA